ncbi:MAG: hypothetical protein M1429_04075 [Patescibacteria group bacterium]|nr:hypothetical protein [Patescibacteria group bacterium]
MKRLILNIFTLISLLVALFSGFALIASLKKDVYLGLATHFWLDIHVVFGSAIIILLILQIILNRAWIFKMFKKIREEKK